MTIIVKCSKLKMKNWSAGKLAELKSQVEKDKALADKDETKFALLIWQGLSELGDRTELGKTVVVLLDVISASMHQNSGITPMFLSDLK